MNTDMPVEGPYRDAPPSPGERACYDAALCLRATLQRAQQLCDTKFRKVH
jgi:hypothetical protein